MKHFVSGLIASFLVLSAASLAHAETISPREAIEHVGQHVTIEGQVIQVSRSKGGTTFINFGGRFPNHVFYGVIFRKFSNRFPDVFALQGQLVALTGVVEMYRGKPQIKLFSSDQIERR